MDKDTCFPSHKTIQDWCGGNISIRSIERAIKWLVDRKFIHRRSRTSKQRYTLFIDKHLQLEENPPDVADETRQPCRQKKKSEEQFSSPPIVPQSGGRKQRKERLQRRRTRSAAVPVKTEQEQAREQSLMLQNALDYIALGVQPNDLPKSLYGLLSSSVEPWFGAMGDKRRQVLNLQKKEDLDRIYHTIEIFLKH
jgi:hypothetical protein